MNIKRKFKNLCCALALFQSASFFAMSQTLHHQKDDIQENIQCMHRELRSFFLNKETNYVQSQKWRKNNRFIEQRNRSFKRMLYYISKEAQFNVDNIPRPPILSWLVCLAIQRDNASQKGYWDTKDIIGYLTSCGADLNKPSGSWFNKKTPLSWAVTCGKKELIAPLLVCGANLFCPSEHKITDQKDIPIIEKVQSDQEVFQMIHEVYPWALIPEESALFNIFNCCLNKINSLLNTFYFAQYGCHSHV